MDGRVVKEDAPVDFPFRPGKDVLPGKGEWFKRNNVFFRDKVGEYSDTYDTCTKVSEKREIARLVVEAVYENGGRFLDADGNDIGYKRSMDKAMKALKDRRHIKGRKSGQAIKKEMLKKKAASPPPAKSAPTNSIPMDRKPIKDPLTTDDAGHALLLLRNAAEVVSLAAGPPEEERPRLPLNKRKPPLEVRQRFPFPPAVRKACEQHRRESGRYVPGNQFDEPRRRYSDRSQSNYSEDTSRSPSPPAQQRSLHVEDFAKAARTVEKEASSSEKLKVKPEDVPVLWQSVIVSREKPQASLAEMLVNAKERLDALSSIQQAVSAPICLIYPPNQSVALRASQPLLNYAAQVSLGQNPLGGQVQLAQFPISQDRFQAASRPGLL